jgi:enoyl-CoA hydratase/carnithine racemase
MSGSTSPVLVTTTDKGVVTVTLNRPERRNALTVDMMVTVANALVKADQDRNTRLFVVTGAGDRAFCAGADLSPDDTPFKPDFSQVNLPFANLLRTARNCAVPVVCSFNGDCVAGGMGFLGVCDVALASSTARFGMTEARIGMFPMQIVAVLRDLIPPRLMCDLAYSGRLMKADEALKHGLLNELCDPADLALRTSDIAGQLASMSPVATRRGKYALRAMADMTFEQMIAFAESQVGPMIMTDDAQEGLRAFNERRNPVWPNC